MPRYQVKAKVRESRGPVVRIKDHILGEVEGADGIEAVRIARRLWPHFSELNLRRVGQPEVVR